MTAVALEGLRSSLSGTDAIRVVAAGKAAAGMARAVDDELAGRMSAAVMTAVVSTNVPGWQTFAATHPQPSPASEAAGRAALGLADATRREGGMLLVCLSGGASAMLAVPADGLSIDEKSQTTAVLLKAGLDIGATNLVRRHLSAIKGGQLAARAGRSITLAISDVCTPVDDDPSVIGSGPTAGERSSFAEALAVIERRGLVDQVPSRVLHHLREGAAGRCEGPVPEGDPRLSGAAYWIIASRREAMKAAAATAERLGYSVHVIDEPTTGEARAAGPRFVAAALAATRARPACVIATGETTVHVRGSGKGGRNQELALSSLVSLANVAPAALASVGTDGVDGPTDAAGALTFSDMFSRLGPHASEAVTSALDDNDSYRLLDDLDALVRIGPTGTNVGDLQVLLLA